MDKEEIIRRLKKISERAVQVVGEPPYFVLSLDDGIALNEAVDLLKETEKMLDKACETIAALDSDFFCEALLRDDGWCEEHCIQNGYVSDTKCVKRWLKKQIKED